MVAALSGCGSSSFGKRAAAHNSDAFRYALEIAPTTLDPGKVQDDLTTELLTNVFEGLVAYDEKNQIVGRLAESWKGSDGGKTWTFTLRKGSKFHNGRAVTADDVKWSFERACAPSLASPTAANYLKDIVGVSDEIRGKTPGIAGIKVVDPQTVQFTLDKPRAYFLGKLTYPCAFVLAKEASGSGQINDVTAAVGTGPFKLAKYDADQQVELDAFSDYYLGAPKVARVLRPIIKDASTRLNLYRTGQLDTLSLSRNDVKSIAADPLLKDQLSYELRPSVYYVGIDANNYPPFKDLRIRRAVAMAIDRDRICNVLLEGMPEAHGFVPPGVIGYREGYAGLPYNPAEAKKLLSSAGYPGGKGLPPLQFVYRAQAPDSQHVSEGVAASLRQNLGMNVQLTSLDLSAFLDGRNKGRYQSYFLSWSADYLDPENFLSFLLTSDSPQNHDGYRNADFDRLCEIGDTTLDEAKRLKAYHDAEDILVQDVGRIPLYFLREVMLVSPRVKGLRNNLFGRLPNLTVSVG